jgi:uncharacterized protein with HEPN domain
MAYRDISVWLEDVLMAIGRVSLYTKDLNSFSSYSSNFLVRDATERNLPVLDSEIRKILDDYERRLELNEL